MPDPSQLTQFPRPSVAVDTAVLCPVPGRGLHVLMTHPGDGVWQLPGSILRPQERLAEAVARCLREKARLVDRAPVQLHVFDQPDRDDRGWVISVAHLDVLSAADVGLTEDASPTKDASLTDDASPAEEADDVSSSARDSDYADSPAHHRKLVPVHEVHELSEEHREIVRVAVHRLRALHERTPDPFGLLETEFSLRQLRELHEVVAGESLQADTFRRTMLPLLDPTGQAVTQGRGRPAQTFTRRSELALRADSRIQAPEGPQ
ncbi:NUDIX hydrolase [Brevibacterium spongiae]|uniref:NUDIX hydrolase n=1 Tax=Brevibacterium spongiae TaxID=2909672 RepID=A0ABY5SP86_9MICO|nr:NUDIX hydrolase [Brevibacterium spongiae]UVI34851.1 NUDIX hydrolase [Brevibacterium spongiae]